MRLKSAVFVAAHVRRCISEGIPVVVERRGAEEAGAIFVVVDRRDGTADLYAQAPQTAFDGTPTDRLFYCVLRQTAERDVAARLERERRFDPDLWIVAIEDRAGRSLLPLAPA